MGVFTMSLKSRTGTAKRCFGRGVGADWLTGPGEHVLEARILRSLADAGREAWCRVDAGRCEAFDYYRACEQAEPPMFKFSALGVFDGDRLVGGAPVFTAEFRLDMGWTGRVRALSDWLHTRAPRLVALRVIGIGSPHADELAFGLEPGLSPAKRQAALETLLRGLDASAAAQRTGVLFVKDVTGEQSQWSHEVFTRMGYARLPTLPVAALELPFKTEAEYMASLSANMRSNLRRKLKKAAGVQVEVRTDVEGVEDELHALRRHTQDNAKANYGDFEELSPRFFRAVLSEMGDNARLLLYRVDGALIGFSLVLFNERELIYKYTGMRHPEATDHGVYFLNWMVMVRMCLERGIRRLHAGETTYVTKTRLGCRLERSWIYFRHRNPLINIGFRMFGPMFAIDKSDPDLRELGAGAPYVETIGGAAAAVSAGPATAGGPAAEPRRT